MMAASQFASLKSCDHLSASPFAGSSEAGPVPAVGAALASLGKEMLRVKAELPPWTEPKRGRGGDAEAQPRWRNISGGGKIEKGRIQRLHVAFAGCLVPNHRRYPSKK